MLQVLKALLSAFHTHNPSPKELRHGPELIPAPRQHIQEHIMPLRAFLLRLPNRSYGGVLLATDRTLGVVVHLVETALMEGVFAEKVHGG